MPSSPAHPQSQLLAAIIGFAKSPAIAAAAELGLADLLAEGPLDLDSLAELTQTHARSLLRLMRGLESEGMPSFERPRLAPLCDLHGTLSWQWRVRCLGWLCA
jgi:hypothetical protein